MYILFKYIFNELKSNKFRTCIMVFSICFASAMLFASLTLSKTLVKMQEDMYKNNIGSSDIVVTAENGGYFDTADFDMGDFASNFNYSINEVVTSGVYFNNDNEKLVFKLRGMNYDDLMNFNPVDINKKSDSEFEKAKIIIGSYTAEKLCLDVGSTIRFAVNGKEYDFEVYIIAAKNGFFANDGNSYSGIVPIEYLSEILELTDGYVSKIYLNVNENSTKEDMYDKLTSYNSGLSVEYSYSDEDIKEESETLIVQMYVLMVIITIMSFYIIFSSFKVLIVERLPHIGTFRSIGANNKKVSAILLVESGLYGMCGGIIGTVMGLLILYSVVKMSMTSEMANMDVELVFTVFDIVLSIVWAIVLAIFSSMMPVFNVRKHPVKDIVLNITETAKVRRNTISSFIVSVLIVAISVGLLYCPVKKYAIVFDSVSLLLLIVGTFKLSPYILNFVTHIFNGLYGLLLGSKGTIALKNIKNSHESRNNILLLELAIATAISVFTITGSIVNEIQELIPNSYKFDLLVQGQNIDDELIEKISGRDDVSSVYSMYSQRNIKINGFDDSIDCIEGIDTDNYLDFRAFGDELSYDEKLASLRQLGEGKNIIMTYVLMDKYNLKIGDTVYLEYADKEFAYKVVDSFYSMLENGGNYAIIDMENFSSDFQPKVYSQIYLNVKDGYNVDTLKKDILYDYKDNNITVSSVDEMAEISRNNGRQKTNIINGLSFVVVIICFFGLLNNLIMSYLERRKSKAIMYSIGMTRLSGLAITLAEAVTSGITGGIIGVAEGIGIINISRFVMKAINKPYPITLSLPIIITFFTVSLITSILAFTFLELKTRKISIAEEIKGR